MRPFLAPIAMAVLGLSLGGCALLADVDASSLATRATAIAACMQRTAPRLDATARADDAASDARRVAAKVEEGEALLARLSHAHTLAQPFLVTADGIAPGVPQAWTRLSDEAAGARPYHKDKWTGMSSEVLAYAERGTAAYDAARLGYLAVSGPAEAIDLLRRWARGAAPAEVDAQGGDVIAATGSAARDAPEGHAVLQATDATRELLVSYLGQDDAMDARTQLLELARLTQPLFTRDLDVARSVGARLAQAHEDVDAMERLEVRTLDEVHADRERVVGDLRAVEAAARHVPECGGTWPLQGLRAPGASLAIPVKGVAAERSTPP